MSRITTFSWPQGSGPPVVAAPGPEPGAGDYVPSAFVPLEVIEDLIPRRLPTNPTQACDAGLKVEITLEDGSTVTYGPCRRPAAIERLRLALMNEWRERP